MRFLRFIRSFFRGLFRPTRQEVPYWAQPLMGQSAQRLRALGYRFHHFLDRRNGQIRATLVSKTSDNGSLRVAVAVRVSTDTGTRKDGRRAALRNLFCEKGVQTYPPSLLAAQIRDRTILKNFDSAYPGPKRLRMPRSYPG